MKVSKTLTFTFKINKKREKRMNGFYSNKNKAKKMKIFYDENLLLI